MADEFAPPPLVLLDRIAKDPENRIVGNRFESLMVLYVNVKLTRADMLVLLGIPPEMESDFDKFKTKHDSFGAQSAAVDAKTAWMATVHGCVKALQFGDITKDQFNAFTELNLATAPGPMVEEQSEAPA